MSTESESSAPSPGTIAFIGGGNMARSLIGGLIRAGVAPDALAVAEPAETARAALAHDFGVHVHAANSAAAADADTVVLAVKPQVMHAVCTGLAPALGTRRPLLISIAAGIRIAQIQDWLQAPLPVVRAMPNTPALIGAGITGLVADRSVDAAGRRRAQSILAAAGRTVWVDDEALMDVVTAVSGSGPAYFFLLVEALEQAGIKEGLAPESARLLACQTCLGAGRMLVEGDVAPAELRRRVTSPGGTTQAALETFEAGGLVPLVARAVAAATARGRAMSATPENLPKPD
jgi:pyrroline-5-carboxylate reductase